MPLHKQIIAEFIAFRHHLRYQKLITGKNPRVKIH